MSVSVMTLTYLYRMQPRFGVTNGLSGSDSKTMHGTQRGETRVDSKVTGS